MNAVAAPGLAHSEVATILSAFTVIADLVIRGADSRFYAGRTLSNAEAAQMLREMKDII